MNVLLLRPPLEFRRGWNVAAQAEIPLALMYLGAALRRAGHQVVLFDGAVETDPSRLAFSAEGVLHVGAAWDDIARSVRDAAPDLVGISDLFYTQMPQALRAAREVRAVLPRVPIVIGGPPVTVRPEDFLAEPAVTAAVLGEGETILPALADALARGSPLRDVRGIAYRDGGRAQVNPRADYIDDLDALPDPAYDLIDLERYMRVATMDAAGKWRWKDRRILTLLTSRGCPYKCTFCAAHAHMGRRYRMQSPERVLAHVRFIARDLGVRHLHFIDDNLAQNEERFHAILDGLIAMRKEGLALTWETPIGMRTDKLTFDVLAKAKEAGCQAIFLTVESGSQRVLDEVIEKHLRLESVVGAAGACKRLGLKARSGFIMGLPGETLADMQITVDFAHMLKRRFSVRGHNTLATPLYGTRLHEICAEKGYLRQEMTPDNVARSFEEGGMIETEDWTIPQLRAMRDRFKAQSSWLHRMVRKVRRALAE
ncbi:MAG: B12-binding domain-containing radical SAM protein [Planctomycetes bacterium]|nr:B12-binding domain-containing radical SAM protein [Planctomycetota bacterium]